MKKLYVIVGPTASGKTDYSIDLAKKIDGEIISADSRQVYTELNYGSGKVTEEEMQNIKHYGLDIASVQSLIENNAENKVNVEIWRKQARLTIKEILANNKTPIIVGGTMHWIDALIYGKEFSEVKPNQILRDELENFDIETLLAKLKSLDEDYYNKIIGNNSDAKNKRRIIRAIEIATANSDNKIEEVKYIDEFKDFEIVWVGLKVDRERLRVRVEKRLEKRWQNILTEVSDLIDKLGEKMGDELIKLGLEYKYATLYIRKEISEKDAKENIINSSMRYARRQMTWWKRNTEISWIEV
jgi:tRNA dimethylallyltransferase